MSLLNTRMQNLRSESNLDKNETRPSSYGAYDMFMQMSADPAGLLTPELKTKAEKSIGRVLETPVYDYDGGVTIGNTRSAIIADDENTSQMFQINFVTLSWGFTIVPTLFDNNEMSMQADFNQKMIKYLYEVGATLDNGCIAALEAAKTQVYANSLNYPVVGNTLSATYDQRNRVLADIEPIMRSNDHNGVTHVLGNAGMEAIIGQLKQKGLYNSENKQLEYLDKVLHFTPRLGDAAGKYATMFPVKSGSLGMLFRFEREATRGTKTADGHEWGLDTLPMLDLPVGTYFYESVGDFSTIAGAASADMTRVLKEHYGFSVDVAYVTPYNSDLTSIANPIYKVDIADEGANEGVKVVITNDETNPVHTQEVV